MRRKLLALAGLFSLLAIVGVAVAAKPYVVKAPPWFQDGFFAYPQSVSNALAGVAANKVTRALGASATINFAAKSVGATDSSAITVTGAQAGDPCFVGTPSAITANAHFSCYVDAANSVKVRFVPVAHDVGTCTLSSGTPSTCTATVLSGTTCVCTNQTTQANPIKCAVSGTTLTATGPNTVTDVVAYFCVDEVDPASGDYYVRVISSQ